VDRGHGFANTWKMDSDLEEFPPRSCGCCVRELCAELEPVGRRGVSMSGSRVIALAAFSCLAGACASSREPAAFVGGKADSVLLSEVREVARREGLVAARKKLVQGLSARDGSRGELERRVMATTRDASLVLPDSVAAMPAAQRARTAIAIVPGTRTGNPKTRDRTRDCLRGAAEASRELGFSTWFIETEPRGSVEDNAGLVADGMREVFETSDAVVILMLSKGAHDVIRYLYEDGVRLPPEQRNKLAVVLSLAGTVQGALVADWMAHSPRPLPSATRRWLRLSGEDGAVGMLEEIARSPWEGDAPALVSRRFPNLKWVGIAMVPDGEDGRIAERLWSPWVRSRVERTMPYYSPSDGFVETAASVLPDSVTVPQWIVAGYGSHSMPNGTYADGGRIAPATTRPGREKLRPESGTEIMSAYLRALPQSLLR